VVEDVHQRHIGLLAALAVVHHHLNAEGPQGHRRRQRHQPRRPIGPPQQQRGQLQAVQGKAKPRPEQPCRHPGGEQQGIDRAPGLQQRQIGTRLQLPGVRTDREGGAEGEVAIEVAVHLGRGDQVVVEAVEQRAVTGLWIPPEVIQGLLIGEALQVVEGAAHRLGGHGMEQGLQPHRAVHRDHAAAGAQVTAERAVVEVVDAPLNAITGGQQGDQRRVVVVAPVPGVVLEGEVIGDVAVGRERANHVLNEVMHAPVGRPHLDLRVAGDLQHRQEKRQMLQQPLLHRLFLPAVQPVTPAAPHLTPQESRRRLQLVLPLNDRVAGEGVLNEGGRLPGLAPAPAGVENDVLRQLIRRRQLPVERRRTVEVGAGIDPVPFQGHVVRPQITQLEHPGLHSELAGLLNGDAVGNDEIPVHEDVADATLLDQLAQKRPPTLHIPVVRNANLPREAEFTQGEGHLGDRDPAAPQIAAEPGEEQTDRAHQQQDRALDAHLHQRRRPSSAQTLSTTKCWPNPDMAQRRRSRPQWRNRA